MQNPELKNTPSSSGIEHDASSTHRLRALKSELEALIELKRYQAAQQLCKELIARFPQNSAGYVGLSKIAFKQHKFVLALEYCEQFSVKFPNELPLLNLKVESLTALDRFEEAERFCRVLIDCHPNKPAGYVAQTRIVFKQQNFYRSLELCERFLQRYPMELPLLMFKAESLTALESFEDSEKIALSLIANFPDKPSGYEALTRLAFRQHDYTLTLARSEEFLQRFPDNYYLLAFKAEALLAYSDFDAFEVVVRTLESAYPDKARGPILSAKAEYLKGHFQKTLTACYKLIHLYPKDTDVVKLLALTLKALSKTEEAAELYQRTIELHPELSVGYAGLISLAIAESRYENALKLCDAAIEKFPHELELYTLKGDTLLALSRLEEAREVYLNLTHDFPKRIQGYVGLYQFYRKLEIHQSALDVIAAAYSINPRNISVITKYVAILELMGKTQEAYRLLEHHVDELNHENCLVPLVNLYSKYGQTSNILELLENHSNFFTRNAELQIKAGLALRNKGNLPAAYTLFQNYLDTNQNVSLSTLKIKFRVYEQLCLLHAIVDNATLFKHFYLKDMVLPKAYLFKNEQDQAIIELIKSADLSRQLPDIHDNKSAAPNSIQLFFRKLIEYAKELESFSAAFSEVYLDIGESPVSAVNLADNLISRIQRKIPTSMIRLGDGEGNYLTYSPQYTEWQDKDIEDIQRIWWGDVKIQRADEASIKQLFAETVENADILGIPDLLRRARDMPNFEGIATNRHNRGIEAAMYHLSHTLTASATAKQDRTLTSCHYHTDLEFWDLFRYILTDVGKVTVITCHDDLGRVLRDKFGIARVDTVMIPAEHRHSHNFNTHETENSHYPDFFNRILSTLNVEPGEVFLVAAGFLGKIYCNHIKNKGGIGIDIGSTADIWMGYSTRMEHEYSQRIMGLALDFDALRARRFPGYCKVPRKNFYRSNSACDMNIYQPGDEAKTTSVTRKTCLITGHPRCGSRYMALLFKQLGLDINHEWFGDDGISSWLFAVRDLNMPTLGGHVISPEASYSTVFDYTLAYVRNPYEAIPSIMLENRVERSYNYRRNHILSELDIDIDDYKSDIERALASYLFWNKIVERKAPTTTFKVEDCVESVYRFLKDNALLKRPVDIAGIDIATNANATASRGILKPVVSKDNYRKIAQHLRNDLASFCSQYGYDFF